MGCRVALPHGRSLSTVRHTGRPKEVRQLRRRCERTILFLVRRRARWRQLRRVRRVPHAGREVLPSVRSSRRRRSFSSALPWAVAGIALVALVALGAGQRFAASPSDSSAPPQQVADQVNADAGTAAPGRPPDISNLTPAERAARLYNRVISAHERGFPDTVQMFAPMAITAFQMIGSLDTDQRYDLGRLAAVAGDASIAAAQADTILRQNQNHLLGLILAANAAHMRKDSVAERSFHQRLVAAATAERAKSLPEYAAHENDITIALGSGRP